MIKENLLMSIAQFEDIYPEWEDYKISAKKDTDQIEIEVIDRKDKSRNNLFTIDESREILNDFVAVLKKNNLKISEFKDYSALIDTYTYDFEPQFEELADRIERTLDTSIVDLVITEENGQPDVKFQYAGNITSGEKSQIKKKIEQFVQEYLENKI
jgi:predicted nuclease with TOPRIM domain